jgi:hypothetical protein
MASVKPSTGLKARIDLTAYATLKRRSSTVLFASQDRFRHGTASRLNGLSGQMGSKPRGRMRPQPHGPCDSNDHLTLAISFRAMLRKILYLGRRPC